MRSQQSGFTLVEIAIVLVIIGLLLGGILKGQELINSAKVKNLANDFRVIPTYIYAYQDKFKSLPGDDASVTTHVTGSTVSATGPVGNGVINGMWWSSDDASEAKLFWQHVRLANLAAGPTVVTDPDYQPTNAVGGKVGINSATSTPAQIQITGMSGTYQVCSSGILGKFAKQLDIQMDDGNTAAGSMRTVANITAAAAAVTAGAAIATASVDDAVAYTVCMTF